MSFELTFLEGLAGALTEVRLEAIVVGNAASILHGAPVLTQDVDVVIRSTPLNQTKLKRLVERLGGVKGTINDLITAHRIHLPAAYVDILYDKIGGNLSFNALKARSERITVGAETLVVASLEDVIRSKEAAGRPKDLAALPILRDTLKVKQALAKSPSVAYGATRKRRRSA